MNACLRERPLQYTVAAGKEYVVTVDQVSEGKARFVVNGDLTRRSIREGDTYNLPDGSILGVEEVYYEPFKDGEKRVNFYIGVNKMELRDDDLSG